MEVSESAKRTWLDLINEAEIKEILAQLETEAKEKQRQFISFDFANEQERAKATKLQGECRGLLRAFDLLTSRENYEVSAKG
jgi:hypothetical protein